MARSWPCYVYDEPKLLDGYIIGRSENLKIWLGFSGGGGGSQDFPKGGVGHTVSKLGYSAVRHVIFATCRF